jgi:hypothetical protein
MDMKYMKKRYQQPITGELLYEADSLLVGSPFKEVETENGGGIDPDTQVDEGLSRRRGLWDDDEEY